MILPNERNNFGFALLISGIPALFPLGFKFMPLLILPHLLWWNAGAIPVLLIDKLFSLKFLKISEFGIVLTHDSLLNQIIISILICFIWLAYLNVLFYLRIKKAKKNV